MGRRHLVADAMATPDRRSVLPPAMGSARPLRLSRPAVSARTCACSLPLLAEFAFSADRAEADDFERLVVRQ
jgi:hypothetical protein